MYMYVHVCMMYVYMYVCLGIFCLPSGPRFRDLRSRRFSLRSLTSFWSFCRASSPLAVFRELSGEREPLTFCSADMTLGAGSKVNCVRTEMKGVKY